MLQVYQKKKKKGRQSSRDVDDMRCAKLDTQTHARNQPRAAAGPHSKYHRPILIYIFGLSSAIYIYRNNTRPHLLRKKKRAGVCVPTEEMEPPFSFTFKSPGPPFFFRHPVEFRSAGELWLLYKRNVPFSVVVVTQSSFYSFWPFIDDFFYTFGWPVVIVLFWAVRDTYILRNMRFYLRTKGEWSPTVFCIFGARGCDATSSATHNSIIHWIVAISFFSFGTARNNVSNEFISFTSIPHVRNLYCRTGVYIYTIHGRRALLCSNRTI